MHTICAYNCIGLYRENAIAIEREANDSFGGNVYYVTMQVTLPIPEFTRNERNLHCDVLHITPDRVVTLVLDDAIASIPTSRCALSGNDNKYVIFASVVFDSQAFIRLLKLLTSQLWICFLIFRCSGNNLIQNLCNW